MTESLCYKGRGERARLSFVLSPLALSYWHRPESRNRNLIPLLAAMSHQTSGAVRSPLQAGLRKPLDIHVRSATPADAEDLHAIALCPNVRANTTKLPHQPLSKTQKQLENLSQTDIKLVAAVDGRVIGTLGIHGNANPARRHAAWLGMVVHDDYQGRGVGTRLLKEGIDLAERWLGLRRIELEVYARNERAIRLYERHGFQVEGHLKDYAFRDGRFVDALAMARVVGLERGLE